MNELEKEAEKYLYDNLSENYIKIIEKLEYDGPRFKQWIIDAMIEFANSPEVFKMIMKTKETKEHEDAIDRLYEEWIKLCKI